MKIMITSFIDENKILRSLSDFFWLRLKYEIRRAKERWYAWLHTHVFYRSIPNNRSMIELDYKRKKFSSITFNSASLSRRAIAHRWSPISHCLGSLGWINRHNLEKYLSYSHSFHWHSNAETSQQFCLNIETALQEQQLIPGRRNRESSIFFLLSGGSPGFLLKNTGQFDAFRDTLALRQRREQSRGLQEVGLPCGESSLAATGQPDLRQLTVPSWIPSRLHEPPP